MKGWSSIRTTVGFLFRRSPTEREIEEELRSHLRSRADDLERQGIPPAEAERQARIEFGGYQRYKEECREALGTRLLSELIADVRFGLRQLRRNPGFTAVAVITLALGVGVNTALFSVIDAVVLHPLPYRDPGRLVDVHQTPAGGDVSKSAIPFSPADFLAVKAANDIFEDMAAATYQGANVTGGDQAMRVWDVRATPSLFSVLGTRPLVGRTLGPSDVAHGASDAVVLGNFLWREAFGGRRDVVGETIQVNGRSCVVVGVMPARFFDPGLYRGTYSLWQPLAFTDNERADHSARSLQVVARLKPGATLARAHAELKTLGERFQSAYPVADKGVGLWAWSLSRPPLEWEYVKPLFDPLYAAAIFVLIVGCVNLANLLLTRGAAREHEIAVRAALGAAPRRLMRQLMTEGVVLAVLGGGAGLLLAHWGVVLLKALIPPSMLHGLLEAHLDWRVLIFAFVVALVAGVLFSLIPAWRTSKIDPHESLKEGSRTASSAATGQRVRDTLLLAEAALALVLLFGAGVVYRAFDGLMHTNPGFNPHHLLAFDVGLDNTHYPEKSTWAPFFERLTDDLKSIPGVTSAVVAENAPSLNDFGTAVTIHIPGAPLPRNPFEQMVSYNRISPGYLQTLRIPLEKGRYFSLADDAASAPVVIVSDTFIRRFFRNENLLGNTIDVSAIGRLHWEKRLKVVGVVHGVRQYSLSTPEWPMIYVPQRQDPSQMMTVILRTGPPPKSLIPTVRRRLAGVTIAQPVWDIDSVKDNYENRMALQHTDAQFFGGFALITLLLAAIGIYGVAAYGVRQRFHEIGIRMALGATRGQILMTVMKQGLAWVLIGIGIGCALLFPFERLLAVMLGNRRGIQMGSTMSIRFDASLAVVILISIAVLVAAALIANLIPARRAAKVDPMVALRYE